VTSQSVTGADNEVTGAPPPAVAADTSKWRRLAPRALTALSVLIPFGVIANVAMHSITTFDGGLNFQVAYNMLHGEGYARNYGGLTYSPIEVETSGFFLVVAAIGFKLLGITNLSLNIPNLLFMLVLLAGASFALRRRPILRLLAPAAVILLTPHVAEFGLDGFGEFVSASLSLWCFILLAEVIEGAARPYLLASLAFLCMGIGLTIKVISIASIPVALGAFALTLLLCTELRRRRYVLTVLWTLVPIGAWEIYRLTEVKSAHDYLAYWHAQLSGASDRAAADEAHVGLLRKGVDHLHLLRQATGLDAAPLVLILVAPLVALAVVLVVARRRLPQWVSEGGHSLALQLGVFAALYEIWWVFLTPTRQAWLRRFEIGWISLVLLTLLLLGMLWDELVGRVRAGAGRRQWQFVAPLVACVVVLAIFTVPAGLSLTKYNAKTYKAPNVEQKAEAGASAAAARLAASGAKLCGAGWWSAPVVSLTSKVSLCNLVTIPVETECSPEWKQAFADGRVFLVWDRYAAGIISRTPPDTPRFTFAHASTPSSYASFWTVSIKPSVCR
jgi:hypothetical protein